MLTLEDLKELGVNTEEGLTRCMNNEGFYIRLVGMAVADANFDRLKTAIEADDLDAAFEAAHALKGVLSNLALTPICRPVTEITELLRTRTKMDYRGYVDEIFARLDELKAVC